LGAGRPEEAPPRSRGSGGGPASLGGGGWVGEHQRRPRKLATGSFGREEERKRELRGSLRGGGTHGGGGGRSRATGATELGALAQERRREG